MEQLIPIKEVAARLGVSVRHLYRQCAAGQFPQPKRIGRSARWNWKQIEDWLDKDEKNGKKR
jgi:excisionase family DNA binding protein